MNYGVLPFFSSQLYNSGNMNRASSSSTFPEELADIIEDEKVNFYSNDFRLEPESYNYYQQPDHRPIDVPVQRPLIIGYHYAGINNSFSPVIQQPFSPTMKLSDWRGQQNSWVMENPKKRMNDAPDQKSVNKKLAHQNKMQGIGCVRERVPIRRSQKLADKITALQKLVSPYGKTDMASVLQEAHISINLLRDQIQKLLQNSEKTASSLRDKGLCLVPVSTLEVNDVCHGKQSFMPRNN